MRTFGLSLVVFALSAAACCSAQEKPSVEEIPAARMGLRYDKPDRLGVFGDYWWANRFLQRHEQIAALKNQTADVVLIGDSIMHYWEAYHAENWAKFTAGRRVINCGYAGDRTQNVIWRIQHGELDGYVARNVVLMVGTNNNSDDSTDPARVAKAIEKIVAMIREKQPTARIVLHPIFPRGRSAESKSHAKARARNEKTNELLKKFAESDGRVVWVDFNAKLLDATGWVPATMMSDQIHPTDAAYDIWAKELASVLTSNR